VHVEEEADETRAGHEQLRGRDDRDHHTRTFIAPFERECN
jgi:hypothetical protein